MAVPRESTSYCPKDCPGCGAPTIHNAAEPPRPNPHQLHEVHLVTASATTFLLPLVGALLGALLASPDPVGQLMGAAGGFLFAIVISILASRLTLPTRRGADRSCL